MKKTLVALAALAATGAFAQSSVTIFGIVDATMAFGTGSVADKTQLTNSGYNSSRLGFRGVEDLGGGLKAGFHIEGALANDNGNSAGLTFQRKTVVSLMGNFGEVKAGRDYTPQFWSQTVYDPFGTNGVGTQRAFLGAGATPGGATAVRSDNTISYVSPSAGGFGVWLQTYFGEKTSDAADKDVGNGGALRVSYDQGPLSVALAYGTTKSAVGVDTQSTNLGGSFKFGAATVMALFTNDKTTNVKETNGYLVGGLIPMGSGTVRLSLSGSDGFAGKADQVALGYVYDMSKRTALYATFANLTNSSGASAALNGSKTKVDGNSQGFDFGIRHSF